MRDLDFLCVYRESVYSPGRVGDDAVILDATTAELIRSGCEASAVAPQDLEKVSSPPAFLLTMAQSGRALRILDGWQRRGTRIINSVSSIRNSYRKPLVSLLKNALLPVPSTRIVKVEEAEREIHFGPSGSYWLKRGDVHAMQPGDVAKVASREELIRALVHFRRLKIDEVLVQDHLEGDVIKFYGVGSGEYFRAFMTPSGDEITCQTGVLSELARRCAEAVGLEIYGGDAVCTEKGEFMIIDLNDWPSFSRCGPSAAREIAKYAAAVCKGGSHGLPGRC